MSAVIRKKITMKITLKTITDKKLNSNLDFGLRKRSLHTFWYKQCIFSTNINVDTTMQEFDRWAGTLVPVYVRLFCLI